MKSAWIVVIGLSILLTGLGVACGPEDKFCFKQQKSCTQAELDKEAADMQRMDASVGGLGDSATVVEAGM